MSKSNFIVRGGGDFSGIYKEFNKAQKKISSFQKGIQKSLRTLGTIIGTIVTGKLIKDSTNAAMSVESSIAQLGRIMGDNANIFDNWAKTQAKAFGMAREEAYKYGATYGNLISTFARDTQETTRYTTELLKASAVVASATGRTMEDTMERIRSGLLGNTEAIEDLGINVNVAMLESTKAFQQFAKGRSWQQLTFQEQQQIRLMAILEQANIKYGDSLAGTTATKQMMFLATLKDIRLNLGQAFLPIYNTILPALTSLVSKIEYVTRVFAQFSQALFGKSAQIQTKQTQEQTKAVTELGDATEEAGKQAKGAVAGFDEINQLSIGETSSNGLIGGIGSNTDDSEIITTGDSETGVINEVGIKAQEMASKVRQAFSDMKNVIVENKNIIVPAIGAISGAMTVGFLYSKAPVVISSLAGIFAKLGGAIQLVWGILAANPILLVVAVIGALIGGLIAAYKTNDKFREKVDNLWSSIKEKLSPILEKLGDIAKNVWQTVFVPFGDFLKWLWQTALHPVAIVIKDVLAIAFDILGSVAKNVWQNIFVPLGDFFKTVLVESIKAIIDVLSHLWNNVLVPIGIFITSVFKPIIEVLSNTFLYLWKHVLKPLIEFMAGVFKNTFETVTKSIGGLINGLKTTFEGLIDFIAGVFTSNWRRAWEGVKNIFKGIVDSLWGIVKAPLNLIIDAINTIIEGLNKIRIEVPSWVPGIGGRSWGVNIPKIPKLARGGIVTSPTLAMIGERGPEAVVPLENTGFVDAIASAVGTAVMSAMQFTEGNTQQGDVIIQLEGTTLARVLNPYSQKETNRIGPAMITTT